MCTAKGFFLIHFMTFGSNLVYSVIWNKPQYEQETSYNGRISQDKTMQNFVNSELDYIIKYPKNILLRQNYL